MAASGYGSGSSATTSVQQSLKELQTMILQIQVSVFQVGRRNIEQDSNFIPFCLFSKKIILIQTKEKQNHQTSEMIGLVLERIAHLVLVGFW